MVKKALLIVFLSLLVFLLSVEYYLEWKKPVPPPALTKRVLFYYYLPWYQQALYYVKIADEENNSYWIMRTLEEVEEAIKRAPTNGVLWFWAAKLRKFLGMRYKEFLLIAFKLDPYRLRYKETLDFLSAGDLVQNPWIIKKMAYLNHSERFFMALLRKLWADSEGKKFLLKWIPSDPVARGRLAQFLINHGVVGRGIYLLEITRLAGEKVYNPALRSILNSASKFSKKGNVDRAEWLLKKVFWLNPLYDNIGVRLANLYLKQGKKKKALSILAFYESNYPDYIVTERLKNFLTEKGLVK